METNPSDVVRLRSQIAENVEKGNFEAARKLQTELVRRVEADAGSNAGEIGDALHDLSAYCFKVGEFEAAKITIAKAIGFLRLYNGKQTPKVQNALNLAKEIQEELAKRGLIVATRKRRKKSLTTGGANDSEVEEK